MELRDIQARVQSIVKKVLGRPRDFKYSPRSGRTTVAKTNASKNSNSAYGVDWYYWSIQDTQLLESAWTRHSKTRYTTEVRAVGSSSGELYCFNTLLSVFWQPTPETDVYDLSELYKKCGSGQSVTLEAVVLY